MDLFSHKQLVLKSPNLMEEKNMALLPYPIKSVISAFAHTDITEKIWPSCFHLHHSS